MGIKTGASSILTAIKSGIYNRRPDSYKLYVDGELMRYKGMVESNLTRRDAEEVIGRTSYNYLNNFMVTIIGLLGRIPTEILVFMDGERVANKETCRGDIPYDATLIRNVFKSCCINHGLTVVELPQGESELQMYLQRDCNSPLNVFLTNDSDMISICYGHKPTSKTNKFNYMSKEAHIQRLQDLQKKHVDDTNLEYTNNLDILDSCLWINCGRSDTTAIGFDFIAERIIYTKESFRTFIALCGTDFTGNLLTNSMINGVLTADKEDREYINTLTDINQIAACFQVLGLRIGGMIKRYTCVTTNNARQAMVYNAETGVRNLDTYRPSDLAIAIDMYRNYIAKGVMSEMRIPRPDMAIVSRHYIYAMRCQESSFVKKDLMFWAKSIDLNEAVENFKKYHGTFNVLDLGKTTRARAKNRDPTAKKFKLTEQLPKFTMNTRYTDDDCVIIEDVVYGSDEIL
uniref:Putative polh/gran n=1 Tax=Kallithea virus TaxID=1654582 RepID=A0A0F7KNI6_9VIRU|nr:putative polh/gran [Kallithea virus]